MVNACSARAGRPSGAAAPSSLKAGGFYASLVEKQVNGLLGDFERPTSK